MKRPRREPAKPPLAKPTSPPSIPGYKIEHELGHGGMGRVYQARQLATKRTVALKVMLEARYADPRHRRRFGREVQIAASLVHPNIARLYASGLHEGHYWFAMEYVDGETLGTHVGYARPGIRTLLDLFVRVCEAVNHAHLRGVIHRDLKPGNILVNKEGQPRVLDFGLAKQLDRAIATEQSISETGQVVGTPACMSPEQTKGHRAAVDIRTDVYSLGVILYRLLTGLPPYGNGDTSLTELLRAINEDDPIPPRHRTRNTPDEVSAIVMKAIEKDPDCRYQSAGELGRDLAAYLAGEPVSAKQGSGWYALRKMTVRYKHAAAAVAAVVVISLGLGLTMSLLFAKTNTELQDVIKEVKVLRESPPDETLQDALADAKENLAGIGRRLAAAKNESEDQRLLADDAEGKKEKAVAMLRALEEQVAAKVAPDLRPVKSIAGINGGVLYGGRVRATHSLDIFVADPELETRLNLTRGRLKSKGWLIFKGWWSQPREPAGSPDGQTVVLRQNRIVSGIKWDSKIWVLDTDDLSLREVPLPSGSWAESFTWSPDSAGFAFILEQSGAQTGESPQSRLMLCNRESLQTRVLTSHDGIDIYKLARWSPDGEWVSFLTVDGERRKGTLNRISPVTSERKTIVSGMHLPSPLQGPAYCWCPDSQRLAVVLDGKLSIAALDGTLENQYDRATAVDHWSPSGRHIAYEIGAGRQRRQLWILSLDDETANRVALPGDSSNAIWSSDSGDLAFWHASQGKLTLMTSSSDGRRLKKLVEMQDEGVAPIAWLQVRRRVPSNVGNSGYGE